MSKMFIGAFADQTKADRALRELEEHGYAPKDISVISSSDKYQDELRDEGYQAGGEVGKSALGGAATGGAIGGLAGLMAGVGVAPALAGFFIGGPIAAALGLAGAAAVTATGAMTGAAAGGLIGALMGLGLSKETATAYDATVKAGGVVLGLSHHEDITAEAKGIMERNGARDVSLVEMAGEGAARDETGMAPTRAEAEKARMHAPSQQPAFGEKRDLRDKPEELLDPSDEMSRRRDGL